MTDELQKALSDVYQNLSKSQEPLGPEFQKVIDDHFWELVLETSTSTGNINEPACGYHLHYDAKTGKVVVEPIYFDEFFKAPKLTWWGKIKRWWTTEK